MCRFISSQFLFIQFRVGKKLKLLQFVQFICFFVILSELSLVYYYLFTDLYKAKICMINIGKKLLFSFKSTRSDFVRLGWHKLKDKGILFNQLWFHTKSNNNTNTNIPGVPYKSIQFLSPKRSEIVQYSKQSYGYCW